MHWKQVTLVGVGLLGGSLGMALRRRKLATEVVGLVRRRASVTECRETGAVDWATTNCRKALRGADLVVFCTPVRQMRPLMQRMLPCMAKGCIVTDVGSVKGKVVRDLEPLALRAGLRFVGSHPMAGSERSGVAAAREDLYENSVCAVTATAQTDADALERIEAFWLGLGAKVVLLDPHEHDALVSRSSHLPHLIAGCLSQLVLDPDAPPAQRVLCANGFRDTTRIASGSVEMWTDIALANRNHIAEALGAFTKDAERLRKLLTRADREGIRKFLSRAKTLREKWRNGPNSNSPE